MDKKSRKRTPSIKDWPLDERPREKLLRLGEHSLSDTELLAILLRSGTKGKNVVDLARDIIQKFKTFRNMSQTDIRDWKVFKGIGWAKITQIKAALEIARRFNLQDELQKKIKIRSTEHVVKLFKPKMRDLKNEAFQVIFCDAKNQMIDVVEIAKGTPDGSNPIIREIISKALQNFASGIICLHNHPAGDVNPSKQDELFTKELKATSAVMDLRLLDHIIFGEEEFYSFDKKITQRYSSLC